ncbi:hypothetical protein DAPPUDRAFT_317613 [Daphnia pulex]|uniref:Uncharacterized protein n=1 Tax=Daphnia pulex TaxID=6669 RepID=E9GGG7_DAPPU|nr:uncharacterized protein LOC124320807 [Daphnia pulicaria]EFX81401.1 hypothetical protein DAPPUDRAFT_317613 [Daphnia pulex]|eukprot:EFX81401.1 hypothetical protein DAPPUDRAFT_317613 [Daphnia pulex]
MDYLNNFVLLMLLMVGTVLAGDMLRKSIVYDKNTPDVFYCPQEKPTGFDNMIVKARSLKKLCEFEGQQLPKHYKSDCYNDVDETEFACKEKHRIMKRLNPPGSENNIDFHLEARKIKKLKDF